MASAYNWLGETLRQSSAEFDVTARAYDEAVRIQQQLVDLYLHRLEQYDRVIPHLENVLRLREDDHDVRALAEECLGVAELRQPAAEMRRFKDVLKYAAKVDPCDLVGKDRHRPVTEV